MVVATHFWVAPAQQGVLIGNILLKNEILLDYDLQNPFYESKKMCNHSPFFKVFGDFSLLEQKIPICFCFLVNVPSWCLVSQKSIFLAF